MSSDDPATVPDADPPPQNGVLRPELEIDGPGAQRRVTVAFRAVLAIPQVVVVFCLGVAAMVVQILGWFAALVMGRLPQWGQRYLCAYLAYSTRVNAYLYLLVDRYPPFEVAYRVQNHPVRIELHPGRLNRLSVLFRGLLAIPALLVAMVLGTGWELCAFFLWLTLLITGRMPQPVFAAVAAVLRYRFRFQSYSMLLTSAYPRGVFGDAPSTDTGGGGITSGTRPLLLTKGARALLIAFVALGIVGVTADAAANVYRLHQHSQVPDHIAGITQR
jgi:hypothetical protein